LNPLSIFSFKTLRNWFRVPWAGLLCLCFIALVTLILKTTDIERYLPSPYFPHEQINVKSMVLKATIDKGENPNVIFIGSSVADMGFDAETFEEYAKLKGKKLNAFNFGINGAGPWVFYDLVRDVLIPETNVKYIFYGLSLVEMNTKSKVFREDQKRFLDSPYYDLERGVFYPAAWLKRFLFNNFLLYRIKDTFWYNIFTDDKDTWVAARLQGHKFLAFKGQHRVQPPTENWATRKFLKLPQQRIDRLRDLMREYSTKGYNEKKLEELIRLCRNNNIKLILVSMPVLTDPLYLRDTVYMNMISAAGGINPMKEFERTFTRICSENKVSCINLGGHTVFKPDDFYDPLHLYHTGANKLAVALAQYFLQNQ